MKKQLHELVLKGTIAAQNAVETAYRKHPRQVIIANRIVAMTALFFMADQAMASGLGDWATKFKSDTLKPLLDFGMYGAYAGGIGCSGVGVKKFVDLSKGDPQTTFGQGAGWTFGGGALMGLGAIANGVGESMSTGTCGLGQYCGQ